MLSIAKLRVGQEAYQLSGVAQSLDDYYTGAGEAAGAWIGTGAERLGLIGDVCPEDLQAVLAGLAPGSGGLSLNGDTSRPSTRRVPGFDLTFKTPKSVSVLYAVSDDPRVQGAIIEAGEVALQGAIGWLEREAVRVRRGTGNEAFLDSLAARDPQAAAAARIRSLPAQGVVAAAFRHRTSRAGDPLLHWHTLVANLGEGPDGRWTALVHPDLYRAARAAGEVFQAQLRAELTRRLGLEWRPGRHVPEIAGVPQVLCDLFSKRSHAIEDWLAATGTPNDPAGRQEAVLATRRAKPEQEGARLDAAWKAEATGAGWGPNAAEALITNAGRRADGSGRAARDDRGFEAWVRELCRELTESDSTFARVDVVEAVAARLAAGATTAEIEAAVARVMSSPLVVPVGEDRWTSADLLAVERLFLDTVVGSRATRAPLPGDVVERALAAAPGLGADQIAAARALTLSADPVSVLVGPAGTGKTYTLDAVRAAFESAGCRVQGAAPSARAAHELQAGAGIGSSTIHRLLGAWSRGYERPGPGTLVVVDEAAMAGIRDLQQVVTTAVAAGARVVLVGDHRQLPEVTAGGGFAALVASGAVTIAELTTNRRQQHVWERTALEQLRDGHVPAAVDAYLRHGRVVVAADRPGMVDVAVERWFDALDGGLSPVLIAGTNDVVDVLNLAVRRALRERGLLGDTVGTWAGREFAPGDRVVARINDYSATTTTGERASVLNGHTGTITRIDPGGAAVVLDHDRTEILLTDAYLGAGGVDHAYALTAHRAQGGTWDVAISVGLDGLYREAGYLVLSRGRHENWLVLAEPEIDQVEHELARHDSTIPLPGEEHDIDEDLDRRLNTSRAKILALTHDPYADAVTDAAGSHDLTTLEANARYAQYVERHATAVAGADPMSAASRVERITRAASDATIGATVKALDRHNIGTVIARDDSAGTVDVMFVSAAGREAVRTMNWSEIEIRDRPPQPAPLTPDAEATVARLTATCRRQIVTWHAVLESHGVRPDDAAICARAAALRIDRAAAALAAAQPEWLIRLLGARPDRPAAAQLWDDTVRDIAAHRERHQPDDSNELLGRRPTHDGPVGEWDRIVATIERARVWLDTYHTAPASTPTRTRSLPELTERRAILEQVFSNAPADHRVLIDHVSAGGMLPFDELDEMLTDALAAQGERRRWIIEHWPHVVEYAEILDALDHGTPGPQPETLLAHLGDTGHDHLDDAVSRTDTWVLNLAARLTPRGHDTPTPEATQLLADVAAFRRRWGIDHAQPLGPAACSPEQAMERRLLAIAIDNHITHDDRRLESHVPEHRRLTLDADAVALSPELG